MNTNAPVAAHVLGSIQRDLDFLKTQQYITPQQYDDILRILPTKATLANRDMTNSTIGIPSPISNTPSSYSPIPPPPNYSTATNNTESVEALYDFQGPNPEDLTFKQGDIIEIKEKVNGDWWRGSLNGRIGLFPSNYVKVISTNIPKEKQSPHLPPPSSSPYNNTNNTVYPPPPTESSPYNNNNSNSNNSYPPPPSASYENKNTTSYPPPPSSSASSYNYPPPSASPYNNNNNNTSYPPPPSASSYSYPPPPQQQTYQEPPSSHGEDASHKAGGTFKKIAGKVGEAATFGFGATLGSQAANSIF
ncbi:SH3 domain-containing protein [Cunninghamella echinulata]|nr:SH3 domain-containing protein [Cunninghamella echinulata]